MIKRARPSNNYSFINIGTNKYSNYKCRLFNSLINNVLDQKGIITSFNNWLKFRRFNETMLNDLEHKQKYSKILFW